jgi:hypothetical protein
VTNDDVYLNGIAIAKNTIEEQMENLSIRQTHATNAALNDIKIMHMELQA